MTGSADQSPSGRLDSPCGNVGFEQPLIGPAVIRRIGGVRYRCAESGGHWGVQTSYFRCSGQCAGIRLSSDGKALPGCAASELGRTGQDRLRRIESMSGDVVSHCLQQLMTRCQSPLRTAGPRMAPPVAGKVFCHGIHHGRTRPLSPAGLFASCVVRRTRGSPQRPPRHVGRRGDAG